MSADILKFQPPAKPRRDPGTKRMLKICELAECIYKGLEMLPAPIVEDIGHWCLGHAKQEREKSNGPA